MSSQGGLSVTPAQAAAPPRRRLGERIATAAVLAPLALVAVVHLSTPWVAAIAAVIALIAAWEWAALSGVRAARSRLVYAAVVALLMAVLGVAGMAALWAAVALATAAWVLAVPWLLWLERAGDRPRWPAPAARTALGVAVLTGGWSGLVVVHAADPGGAWLLLLLIAVWTADTAAYFAGRRWGRRRLAPRLSPGKTMAGGVAGLAAGAAVAVPWAFAVGAADARHLGLVVTVTLIATAFSVVGDLTESVLKRAAGVKDSGQLLPGHGGMLDRIDSLLAAAPVLAMALRTGGLAS